MSAGRRRKIQMKPEWNAAQTVQLKNRTVTVAASPYDVPESFSMESDGTKVTITPVYDFNAQEPMRATMVPSDRVRIFLGQTSGRVMRVEIDAKGPGDAAKALREAADLLSHLATQAEHAIESEPIRRSVHLGMFVQALPMMGPDLEYLRGHP